MVACPAELNEFQQLMSEVRAGSEDAFRQMLDEYGTYVVRTVRRNLNRHLRARFDSEDFEQSVWLDVHRRRAELEECSSPEALIAMLVRLANRKVLGEFRRQLDSEKLNLRGQTSSDVNVFRSALSDRRVPTPSEAVIRRESSR